MGRLPDLAARGDVSVLHRYWITLPGNEGKSIEEFIDELFDCHCDGITVSVFIRTSAWTKYDGTLNETYDAQLRVGGGGTQVQVTGKDRFYRHHRGRYHPALFTIPRGEENIPVSIACTQSGNTVMKHAVIPRCNWLNWLIHPRRFKYRANRRMWFLSRSRLLPGALSDGVVVYDADGIVEGSGWVVSNRRKTFTRTYERTAVEEAHG